LKAYETCLRAFLTDLNILKKEGKLLAAFFNVCESFKILKEEEQNKNWKN
jgi:hypothetical protein